MVCCVDFVNFTDICIMLWAIFVPLQSAEFHFCACQAKIVDKEATESGILYCATQYVFTQTFNAHEMELKKTVLLIFMHSS